MGRFSTSVSLTPENAEYLKDNKLSPSDLLNKYVGLLRRGAYDEDREAMVDELVERFLTDGRGRKFEECKDWLKSPAWKEDLSAVGITPLGFMSLCRKRIESMGENGIDPVLQFMVGIIKELPPSVLMVPKLSLGRRRYLENQAALANEWEKDREAQARDKAAE